MFGNLPKAGSLAPSSTPNTLFPATVEVTLAVHPQWRPDDPGRYCGRCGESVGPHEVRVSGCGKCAARRLPWERLVRLGAYEPPLASWIVAMKFARAWSWASWIGDRLAEQVRAAEMSDRVAVCPVPMAWSRRVRRGYNQAALISTALADRCDWPSASILRRRRRTPPQTTVSRSQRSANAGRSFTARPIDLTGWTVWLVDDVKTTGATLRACTRCLRAAGASRVCVAVAAVTDAPTHARSTAPAGGGVAEPVA